MTHKIKFEKTADGSGVTLHIDRFQVIIMVPEDKRFGPQWEELFKHEGIADYLQTLALIMKVRGDVHLFEVLGKKVGAVWDAFSRAVKEADKIIREEDAKNKNPQNGGANV